MTDDGRWPLPSGITGPFPDDGALDVRARLTRLALAIEERPVGESAPCMNPECSRPVDYTGNGPLPLYCSHTCRSRASTIRAAAQQQLAVLEQLLEETRHMRDVPRDRLRARARQLRWWLTRLSTYQERSASGEQAQDD